MGRETVPLLFSRILYNTNNSNNRMSHWEPYIVYDVRNGREICQCASFDDALMLIAFDPDHRKYKKRKFILDHIVDVSSQTLDPDKQLKAQNVLPERQEEPLPTF